jgi:glycine hydroxymethyltransferase
MADVETGRIDYDEMRAIARRERPKILLAGFSAYPRELDYAAMRSIASEVGAYAVADVAHIAGLIVGGALANPFAHGFDVVLTTTHKTLRGPRGGLILSRDRDIARRIDKSVFPGFQGGPIMQMVAAKAVAFAEAERPGFRTYAAQVIANAKAMAERLMQLGARLVTNGTDNHLMLVDAVASWGVGGAEAQQRLDAIGITLNKNVIADDPRGPMNPSGIRLGTPALTTRGMGEAEMRAIAELIDRCLRATDGAAVAGMREAVVGLSLRFPVPGLGAAVAR